MNNPTARLTIPMDKSLRVKLGKRADELGFDSPQALLRYVSKTLVDGRKVTFGEVDYLALRDKKDGWDDWGPVPNEVLERWAKQAADERSGKAKLQSFDNIDDLLADLKSYVAKRNQAK
ncbi:hypothetical protein COY17_01685 [Candidatus Saccharibacteria bacterium CG_4_10_14_0_2_um_filter_52_9]|nr:MAG: hypothetical protein COY17_01685 [Candidatus Saccharibacteria bacterium CG_4_10_14_0_2_um_filter_52_9]